MLAPLLGLIIMLIGVYAYCVIAWLIMTMLISFNVINRQQKLVMNSMYVLNRLCGPPLYQIRRRLPNLGPIDITPIILLVLLSFAQNFLHALIIQKHLLNPFVILAGDIITLYMYCVIAWMILSMMISFRVVNRGQQAVMMIMYTLDGLCGPALDKIRGYLPNIGVFDLAPVALIFLLHVAENVLFRYFYNL